MVAFGCVGFCGCWLGVVFALPAPLLFPLSPRLGCLLPFLSCKSWALPRPVAAGSPILSHSLTSLCRSPSSYPDVSLCLLPVFAGDYILLALVMAPQYALTDCMGLFLPSLLHLWTSASAVIFGSSLFWVVPWLCFRPVLRLVVSWCLSLCRLGLGLFPLAWGGSCWLVSGGFCLAVAWFLARRSLVGCLVLCGWLVVGVFSSSVSPALPAYVHSRTLACCDDRIK